jgi:hypothetical protein
MNLKIHSNHHVVGAAEGLALTVRVWQVGQWIAPTYQYALSRSFCFGYHLNSNLFSQSKSFGDVTS